MAGWRCKDCGFYSLRKRPDVACPSCGGIEWDRASEPAKLAGKASDKLRIPAKNKGREWSF